MRSRPVIGGAVILTLLTLVSVSPASAEESPPAAQVVVDVVTAGGTGCPPGTTIVTVAPDNTTFSVTYTQYLARIGVGSAPTDFRKNCQLSLGVHVPDGYTFALARSEYNGFASLAAGATGMQRSTNYFTGQGPTPFITHTFTGPFDDNWQTTDVIDIAAMVFHPCGAARNLNINTDLRVLAGTSDPATTSSFLSMRSSVSTIFEFAWKHCA